MIGNSDALVRRLGPFRQADRASFFCPIYVWSYFYMAMIEVQKLHKWYGDFHVLQGITESVDKGEVLVICGPSGSGKSTFIRCINRLEEYQKGQIFFDGQDIQDKNVNVNDLRAEKIGRASCRERV